MSSIETKSIVWNVPSLKWEPLKSKTFCTWPHGKGFCLKPPQNEEKWRCKYHKHLLLENTDPDNVDESNMKTSWYWQDPTNQHLQISMATRHVYTKEGERLGRLNVYENDWWLD